MALLKTVANSAPMAATANASSTGVTPPPGTPNHKAHAPTINRAPKPAIHGLRGPAASAIAPRIGENTAMMNPAEPLANPHSA